MRRATPDRPSSQNTKPLRVHFDGLIGGAVRQVQHAIRPQVNIVRPAQAWEGRRPFAGIRVDDRDAAVAFIRGIDPCGSEEVRGKSEEATEENQAEKQKPFVVSLSNHHFARAL